MSDDRPSRRTRPRAPLPLVRAPLTQRGQARPPQRVRVTNPRMGSTTRPPARSPAREIDELTGLGEVYMRSLLRAQLRQAITSLTVLVLVLGVLPLVFAWRPELTAVSVAMIPLPWLLIGILAYPAMVALALWQERAADRAERQFRDIVEQNPSP